MLLINWLQELQFLIKFLASHCLNVHPFFYSQISVDCDDTNCNDIQRGDSKEIFLQWRKILAIVDIHLLTTVFTGKRYAIKMPRSGNHQLILMGEGRSGHLSMLYHPISNT